MHLLINASIIVWAIAGGYRVVDVIQLRKENDITQALDAAKEKALESSASAGDTLAATLTDDAGGEPDDDLDKSAREAQEVRDSAKKKEEDLKEARVTICLGLYGALVCLMPRPSMKSTYEEALNSNGIIRNRQRLSADPRHGWIYDEGGERNQPPPPSNSHRTSESQEAPTPSPNVAKLF